MAMAKKVVPLALALAIVALALSSSQVYAQAVEGQASRYAKSAAGELGEYKLGEPLYRVKGDPTVRVPATRLNDYLSKNGLL